MDVQFEDEMEKVDSPCLEESIIEKEVAKDKLNAVFQILNIEKIRDDRRFKKIREQIDYVYRHLKHLCDILEENDSNEVHDMNPDSIRIKESNELLYGVKELFQQSTYEEQVRLMTIAPNSWGRIAIAQWFGASDHQARLSILLRRDRGVLAFPEYTRGNKFLDEDTVQSVVQFYLQDGVSRVSSNSKDVLKIKNELVPVRFMEMSIGEVLRKFYDDHPAIRVAHSYFNREQRNFINELRIKSSPLSYAVVQIDFAENYTFLRQREVQAAHWNNQQATLFTIHIKIGSEHKNMLIISDYMRHDTAFVFCAQRLIIDYLRKHYPDVKKVNYLSDGAPAHFKNHFNMINLQYHQHDFNISTSWTFSASGHGKGPCDGIGGVVKSSANHHILLSNTVISCAEDFFNFTKKFNEDAAKSSQMNEPPINVYYLKRNDIETVTEDLLTERWYKKKVI
ncbi:unnamed protein product [Rotaria magnacalcarata]|uniref:Uncharacterized protein n=2 Tax=Rotaria magnacalcarata TaxID=392030 RepID=A0A816RJC5_9BILA|nr:unnamed protein product [Rotaria magnacalcarata]